MSETAELYERQKAQDATEWLREFQKARHDADYALGAIAGQVTTLYDAGLTGVAATFDTPLRIAGESVAAMGAAISRMIRERAQEVEDQTKETLLALLKQPPASEEEVTKASPNPCCAYTIAVQKDPIFKGKRLICGCGTELFYSDAGWQPRYQQLVEGESREAHD